MSAISDTKYYWYYLSAISDILIAVNICHANGQALSEPYRLDDEYLFLRASARTLRNFHVQMYAESLFPIRLLHRSRAQIS